MKKIMLLFIVLVTYFSASAQYPLAPQNQQHYINGTVGEERGGTPQVRRPRTRYHYGLDLQEANGTTAFAIEAGLFNAVGSSCAVGHYGYVHVINPPDSLEDGVTIVHVGEAIGEVSAGHVHLQRSSRLLDNITDFESGGHWINPIAGLNPTDIAIPRIESLRLYRNSDHTAEITGQPTLFGKLDLLMDTEDQRINVSGTGNGFAVAPLRMSWALLDLSNNAFKNFPGISFVNVPPNASAPTVFGSNSLYETPNFEYWLTHNAFTTPYDRYWNTRQKRGQPYDISANYPFETEYNDGTKLKIGASSCDNSNNCSNTTIPATGNYQIDNFKPFVREVSVRLEGAGRDIYYNRWDPISGKGIKESSVRLAQRAEGAVKDLQTAGALKVYAILSERMQWAKDVFA